MTWYNPPSLSKRGFLAMPSTSRPFARRQPQTPRPDPVGSAPPDRSAAQGGSRRRDSGLALARRVPLGSSETFTATTVAICQESMHDPVRPVSSLIKRCGFTLCTVVELGGVAIAAVAGRMLSELFVIIAVVRLPPQRSPDHPMSTSDWFVRIGFLSLRFVPTPD